MSFLDRFSNNAAGKAPGQAPLGAADDPRQSFLKPAGANLLCAKPLNEWHSYMANVKAGQEGLIMTETGGAEVHSYTYPIMGVKPDQAIRFAAVLRANQRPSAVMWIFGKGPPEQYQAEAILDLTQGAIARTRISKWPTNIESATATPLGRGWTGYEFKVSFPDKEINNVAIVLAARASVDGSSAYQGENKDAIDVYGVSAL